MSLIPYHPREGRQIVLRHQNALVVRDPTSERLEIRGLPNCPTCHRPWQRSSSPERHFEARSSQLNHDFYVDPNYFRMLRPAENEYDADHPPPSPVRRLAEPVRSPEHNSNIFGDNSLQSSYVEIEDEERPRWPRRGSNQTQQTNGSRIRRESFSPNYFNDFFVEEKVLGKGGKGVVLLVSHQLDGCPLGLFACKRVPVGDDHAWLEKVLVEVKLLAALSHPNLVSYRHVWLEDAQLTRFGPPVVCAYILQQYCNGGDLHRYVLGDQPKVNTNEALKARLRRRSKGQAEIPADQKTLISPEEIYSVFKDITSGVAYLHAANYVHRDLKPSNCLLHREGGYLTCLISDFGEVQPEVTVRSSTGSTGTISYCAPEVLQQDASGSFGNFTYKSDIFSMGMILYFMCFGRLPYRSANALEEELEDVDELRAEISDWKGFQDEKRLRPDLPPKLYQLLKQLLALNPAQRPSASEVLHALNSEARFDNLGKGARASTAPAMGLRGRVQNLDSPAIPGTPVPDPPKQSSRPGTAQERAGTWPLSDSSHTLRGFEDHDESEGLRQRTNALTLTRGRDQFPSPTRERLPSPLRPDTSHSGSEVFHQDDQGPLSPPLLLPPPESSVLSRMSYNVSLALQSVAHVTGISLSTAGYALRLALFLLKISSLAQPCWPYVPTAQVAVPLVTVAALDLRTGSEIGGMRGPGHRTRAYSRRRSLGITIALVLLHVTVLWLSRRRGGLCVAVRHEGWPDW